MKALEMMWGMRVSRIKSACVTSVMTLMLGSAAVGQETPAGFSGSWAMRLDNHIFLVVTLESVPGNAGHFTGTLSRPQHFTTSGVAFSAIKGPTEQEAIVRSRVSGNCVSFTTRSPKDKSDETDFQLCQTDSGRGTLKINVPGIEAWPVSKEKAPVTVWTEWEAGRSYLPDEGYASNPEMEKIFVEDQRVRQTDKIDWTVVEKSDATRRVATLKLLNEGELHTGEDFQWAAFVFQHGDTSDDYLLAHTLATVAVAKGQSSAMWISAATLDRYLQSIHQPQIFGTQFYTKPNEPTTQEPYNRGLVSDALRRQLGVPSQAAQEQQRKQDDAERMKP